MKILAIIPARKGSKRIKDKNLQTVGGYTLIEHAVLSTACILKIERVVISTDYDNLELCPDWPVSPTNAFVDVLNRPPELADDNTTTEAVMEHILGMDQYHGYDYVVLLQPTSPLRTRRDVYSAIKQIVNEGTDSLFSAAELPGFIWSHFEIPMAEAGLRWHGWVPEYNISNRPFSQNMPSRVHENGAIYIFKPWVLKETGGRLGGKISVYLMDRLRSVDIDTPEDLDEARRIARFINYEQNDKNQ